MASPVINNDPYRRAVVGKIDQFEIKATDADGDQLTYSVDQLPEGLNLIGNVVQGTYINTGTTVSTFSVSDGTNTTTATVTFLVRAQGVDIGEDIILRNLTSPPVAGTSSPIIGTRSDLRDGARGNTDPGPETPPPSGGMDAWGIAPNGGGGGQGHLGGPYKVPASGLYDMNKIQYLGAFAAIEGGLNNPSHQNSRYGDMSYSYCQIGFNPPNGNNGTYGSLFVAGNKGLRQFVELQIPETLSDPSENDFSLLPSAPNISRMIDVSSDTQALLANGDNDTDWIIASITPANGKVFVASIHNYQTDGNLNANCIVVYDDATDIENSTVSDLITFAPGSLGNLWGSPVPSSHQDRIGAEWLMGAGKRYSNTARHTLGPSLYGANLESYISGNTSIATIEHLVYPYPRALHEKRFPQVPDQWRTIEPGDMYNEASFKWYSDQLGITQSGKYPNGHPQQGQYIIPPPEDSYEFWANSDPRTEFEDLGYRPDAIANDLFTMPSVVSFGFIVPGTRTYLSLGTFGGRRYGALYKRTGFNRLKSSGGYPVDDSDFDNYFWAYDLDTISAQTNPWDAQPYDYGVFENNRWLQKPTKWGRVYGMLLGGCFDPINRRLYLAHENIYNRNAPIVAVYKV